MTESKSQRHILIVVSAKGEMSANSSSPESMMESAVFSHSQSNAALSQPNGEAETVQPEAPRANKLSTRLSESVPLDPGPIEAIRSLLERLGVADELVAPVLQVEAERPLGFAKRQLELLAVNKIETNAYLHSPITSAALMPLAPLPAILSQADSFSESSMRLDQLVLKPPDNGGPRQRLYDTVSVSFTPSVTLRSPEFEMGFNPVSQPGHVWADSASHPSSLELVWWERIKPPNMAACRRFLREAIKTLSRRTGLATHCSWPTFESERNDACCLLYSSSLWFSISIAGHGRGASRCLRCSPLSLDSLTSW